MLTRYKLYVGSDRYKLRSPSFNGKGSFVKCYFNLSEDTTAHHNVTCFDGGDGSVTVVASGGTPPYQYSLDPTFSTYNTDGVFTGLSLVAPVDEGTDEYGGILISHRTFYVRDAEGLITSCVVDLQSPVELEWLNCPDDIVAFCDPAQNYATVVPNVNFNEPYISTKSNNAQWTGFDQDIHPSGYPPTGDFRFIIGRTYPIQYMAMNDCVDEFILCEFSITALPLYYPNAIQDYDGNWYDAVVIGNQVWLASNLRTTHYADGTPIPAGGSMTSDTDPYYYDYSSSGIPLKDRGYLYNWPAVMKGAASSDLNPSGVQGIAPTGWHVPSNAEWRQLTNYVGSVPEYILDNNNSYIAKALASQNYWTESTNAYSVGNGLTANNKTLFGAVPSGYCFSVAFRAGSKSFLWSSTEHENETNRAWDRNLDKDWAYNGMAYNPKSQGSSVRCVCDLSPMDFAAWYYDQYGTYNHQLPTE